MAQDPWAEFVSPAARAPAAQSAPASQPAPRRNVTTRTLLEVPDERADRSEQRDQTRTEIAVGADERAREESRFNRITTYRKEFMSEPLVREFRGVKNATNQIIELAKRENDQPGPGDIALIISFMKALDPGSVVRETEFATAENAGGVPETVRNAYNKLMQGGRLTPEIKQEFARTASAFYNSRLSGYNAFAEDYRGMVKAEGADPDAQGIRLAEPIEFGSADPARAIQLQGGTQAPATRVAGDDENFLTTQDQQDQARANQLWASGAPLSAWQAFAQETGRVLPFSTEEEYARARASNKGIRIPPSGRDPRADMGALGSLGETITGSERSTPEVEALPDWSEMPTPGFAGFKAALGTLMTDPQETAQVIVNQFPGTTVRQDAKGNYILRSSIDGKEYAIKPGFRGSDIPRAASAVLAFTPAGRAATLPGSFAAGAGTQAIIEGVEASAGGNFDAGNIPVAGAGNAGGVLLQRGVGAGLNRFRQPSQSAPNLSPMAAAPEPVPQAPVATAAPEAPPVDLDAAAGGNLARPVAPEQATEFGEVAKAALGRGKAARDAKEKLAIVAQANPEAKAAAERLGIDLPIDVIADDARLLTAQGLARSQISSGAQNEWAATAKAAIDKSDATLAEIGASRDLAQLSDDVRVRLQGDMDALEVAGDALRADVNAAIDVRAPVEAGNVRAALQGVIDDLGGIDAAKSALSSEERKLLSMLGEGETAKSPTYAYLDRVRDDIGRALFKKQGPWADTNEAALKKYYGALAEDRVAHVQAIGGDDLANKLRASNDTFVKMYGVRSTMQTVFGKTLEKDIGTLVTRSIGNASKGDAKDLRTLLAAVPKDMQGRTVLSGLMAKAERASSGGGFSFNEYAKIYRGMRQNAPVYAEIAKTIGPKATQILQDLYVISSRMAAAEAKIVRTGASNQPILNALRSESLVAKTLEAGKRVGARGAGAVVGGTTGGPVGAAVGQEISGALVDAMTKGTRSLDQLHALLSSESFRDLVIKAGTGNGDIRAASRVAGDPAFVRFGRGLGLDTFDKRRRWLIDAMTATPAASAGNVVPIGGRASAANLPLAAEERSQSEGSASTGSGTQ